jgi:trimeric autotransporter adhesin
MHDPFAHTHPPRRRTHPLRPLASLGAAALASIALAGGDCTPGWDYSLGVPGASSGLVAGLTLHDAGNGPQLYAGGNFTAIGGTSAARVARLDTGGWSALGSGLSNAECYALASFQGSLYAAGYFDLAGGVPGTAKLARWDGSQWLSVGAQLEIFSNQLWGLTRWANGDGDNLYIAGNFQNIGGTTASFIARFDGTNFHPLGGAPIAGNVPLIVFTSHVHDDGSGEALYIGGRFTSVDGVSASRIARWNGTSWSAVGSGVTGAGVSPSINTMVTFDDGSGPALYVGGQAFTTAGGVPANRVARWNGSQWQPVGDGFANGIVWKLAVYDDGDGERLYAFGTFTASGATPISRMARWNGTSWEAVGNADNTAFNALVLPLESGERLLVSGQFTQVDGQAANRLVEFVGCPNEAIAGDLNGDGAVDAADLALFLGSWGGSDPNADLNGDGSIDAADLSILLGNWG